MEKATSLPDKIILFDSLCNLCNGWSRFVLKRDRDAIFTLCRVQSPAGQELLSRLGLPQDTYETMILLERDPGEDKGDDTGEYRDYHKSEAALRIAAHLPGPWRHLTLLRWMPQMVRDFVYDAVARNRYRLFGKRDECKLPDTGERERFLEEIDAD